MLTPFPEPVQIDIHNPQNISKIEVPTDFACNTGSRLLGVGQIPIRLGSDPDIAVAQQQFAIGRRLLESARLHYDLPGVAIEVQNRARTGTAGSIARSPADGVSIVCTTNPNAL